MSTKEHIEYSEVVKHCRILAGHIQHNGIAKIVAVTRGGMVPACLLAQFLNIRKVGSISLASYEGSSRSERINVLTEPNFEIDAQTLFVDDLYDSGSTYRFLKEKYPQAKCAVVYTKDPNAALDFPAVVKDKNSWLVFPWEFDAAD